MNKKQFIEQIKAEYRGCGYEDAEKIAFQAKRYHENKDTDKSINDWISLMNDSGQQDPIHRWNWAVGFASFGDGEEYQL